MTDFQQSVEEQLNDFSVERVNQLKKIKSWKRSTEIASTSNQSFQAAVDGLIEPSR